MSVLQVILAKCITQEETQDYQALKKYMKIEGQLFYFRGEMWKKTLVAKPLKGSLLETFEMLCSSEEYFFCKWLFTSLSDILSVIESLQLL